MVRIRNRRMVQDQPGQGLDRGKRNDLRLAFIPEDATGSSSTLGVRFQSCARSTRVPAHRVCSSQRGTLERTHQYRL
jgi:hypothetical protein